MSESRLSSEQAEVLNKKVFATVATVNPDGSPQVTLVWADTDGENLYFNTSKGRVKDRNLRRDPRVSVSVFDPEDPYGAAFTIRGHAELIEDETALAHINSLTKKYTGQDEYPWLQPGEVRVKVKVVPERVRKAM